MKYLSSQMSLEPAEEVNCPQVSAHKDQDIVVNSAQLPNGQRIALLKTLLSSACEMNCLYCPFRAGRDFRRATFKPDEMAKTYMAVHRAGVAEGLFLSSGVAGGGMRTQDRLLATAEILRRKFRYRGYLHLKIMPGAEKTQVTRALELADRVSINLEAPNPKRLKRLAPGKQFHDELLAPLQWVDEIRRNRSPHHSWNGRWPSSVTQFVVGATKESDLEILQTTEYLYHQTHLARAYFSPFRPVPDTPFEDSHATPTAREHRLYQASFLLRDYGFQLEDLPFDSGQNLPLAVDPKLAWANLHLRESPIEINQAHRSMLLRVPGIGPKGAEAILKARRMGMLHNLSSLHQLGIATRRVAPFILLAGKRPAYQQPLFGNLECC